MHSFKTQGPRDLRWKESRARHGVLDGLMVLDFFGVGTSRWSHGWRLLDRTWVSSRVMAASWEHWTFRRCPQSGLDGNLLVVVWRLGIGFGLEIV